MDIRSLLKVMVDHDASDLYLTIDAPPIYRIHGATKPTEAPPFNNEQLEALALALMRGSVSIFLDSAATWGWSFALSKRKYRQSSSLSSRRSSKTSP